MNETKSMDILKQALLLEKRGKSFYHTVAQQTDKNAVKSFFESMAEEEQKHIEILEAQFKAYAKNGAFIPDSFNPDESSDMESRILNKEIKNKISAASYEAAAIGAAISMEKQAVKIYKERALSATDAEEKRLYEWLTSWEISHLNMLLEIDKALVQEIWHDNQFWPF